MKARKKKIPRFKNDEEAAKFWDTHSSAPYWDSMKEVKVTFARPLRHMISLKMELSLFNKIRQVAAAKGLPYQTLMQQWLTEKVNEELPSANRAVLSGSLLVLGARNGR